MSDSIACVRVPGLPILAHHGLADPYATPRVVHQGRGARGRVVFCDEEAERLGIAPGQTIAAARSRTESLRTLEYDPGRIARAQREVVERLLGVSPRIAVGGVERFWVEPVVGARGSLEAWCEEATERLIEHRPVTIGVGPTATVAYAAARSVRRGFCVIPGGAAQGFLDEAPLEVLGIGGEALDVLASLGIRRVRELRALDPVSLGMRFGPEVAEARRRAEGYDLRRPLTPRAEDEARVELALEDPIEDHSALLFLLRPAAERLLGALRARDLGALEVRLELGLGRGGAAVVLTVRTASPLDDERMLLELLRTRLDHARLRAPVVGLVLGISATAPLGARTQPLLGEMKRRDPAARDVTLARLRSRFGEGAVRRAERVETGAVLGRARFLAEGEPRRGEALPFRRLIEPAPIENGKVFLEGRVRRVVRLSRVEQSTPTWWEDGVQRLEMTAWAELEGPLLVLLRARVGDDCDDLWEVVAFVD
jgi:protein ImuB